VNDLLEQERRYQQKGKIVAWKGEWRRIGRKKEKLGKLLENI